MLLERSELDGGHILVGKDPTLSMGFIQVQMTHLANPTLAQLGNTLVSEPFLLSHADILALHDIPFRWWLIL